MVKLRVKIDTTFGVQIKYTYNMERQTDFLHIKRKDFYNTTVTQLTCMVLGSNSSLELRFMVSYPLFIEIVD
jgi:hypothetical protein